MLRRIVVVILATGVLALGAGIVVAAPEHAGGGGISIRALLAADLALAVAVAVVRVPGEPPARRLTRRLLPLAVAALAVVVGWVTVLETWTFPGSVSEACAGYNGPGYRFEVTMLPAAAWCVSADGVRTPSTDPVTSILLTVVLVASLGAPALVAAGLARRRESRFLQTA